MSNSIKVVCRFRPQNRIENEQGAQPVVKFEADDTCALDVGVWYNYLRIQHSTNTRDSLMERLVPLHSIVSLA